MRYRMLINDINGNIFTLRKGTIGYVKVINFESVKVETGDRLYYIKMSDIVNNSISIDFDEISKYINMWNCAENRFKNGYELYEDIGDELYSISYMFTTPHPMSFLFRTRQLLREYGMDRKEQQMGEYNCFKGITIGNFAGDITFHRDLTSVDWNNKIKNVYFNEEKKTTVIKWKDGTQTKVTCQPDDKWNPTLGFLACILKYSSGNKGNYNEILKKWVYENPNYYKTDK